MIRRIDSLSGALGFGMRAESRLAASLIAPPSDCPAGWTGSSPERDAEMGSLRLDMSDPAAVAFRAVIDLVAIGHWIDFVAATAACKEQTPVLLLINCSIACKCRVELPIIAEDQPCGWCPVSESGDLQCCDHVPRCGSSARLGSILLKPRYSCSTEPLLSVPAG
jgi:hypothetical protein